MATISGKVPVPVKEEQIGTVQGMLGLVES